MKIYALRDRLLDHFRAPFTGPEDADVKQALATHLMTGEDDVTQAPQHFELWTLAIVDRDTGHITPHKEFLADASSLVRRDIRGGQGKPAAPNPTSPEISSTGAPSGAEGNT